MTFMLFKFEMYAKDKYLFSLLRGDGFGVNMRQQNMQNI
jgi:hypothetical protein